MAVVLCCLGVCLPLLIVQGTGVARTAPERAQGSEDDSPPGDAGTRGNQAADAHRLPPTPLPVDEPAAPPPEHQSLQDILRRLAACEPIGRLSVSEGRAVVRSLLARAALSNCEREGLERALDLESLAALPASELLALLELHGGTLDLLFAAADPEIDGAVLASLLLRILTSTEVSPADAERAFAAMGRHLPPRTVLECGLELLERLGNASTEWKSASWALRNSALQLRPADVDWLLPRFESLESADARRAATHVLHFDFSRRQDPRVARALETQGERVYAEFIQTADPTPEEWDALSDALNPSFDVFEPEPWIDRFAYLLGTPNPNVRAMAARLNGFLLTRLPPTDRAKGIDDLRQALGDPNPEVVATAARALREADPSYEQSLEQALALPHVAGNPRLTRHLRDLMHSASELERARQAVDNHDR